MSAPRGRALPSRAALVVLASEPGRAVRASGGAPLTPTRVGHRLLLVSEKEPSLGERELDLMQALWRRGSATVGEVHAELLSAGSDLAYNTVQTMLNRLEQKGLVGRDATDRAHRYRPRLKQRTAAGGAIRRL